MSWILSECCSCETPGSDRDCDDVADDHLMSLGTVIVSQSIENKPVTLKEPYQQDRRGHQKKGQQIGKERIEMAK